MFVNRPNPARCSRPSDNPGLVLIDSETVRDIGESNRLMKEANELAERAGKLAADANEARDEAAAKASRARDLRNGVCGRLFIGAGNALAMHC